MSTKTIYKRIALVAVAALGAGVLSVAPASAANNNAVGGENVAPVADTLNVAVASSFTGAAVVSSVPEDGAAEKNFSIGLLAASTTLDVNSLTSTATMRADGEIVFYTLTANNVAATFEVTGGTFGTVAAQGSSFNNVNQSKTSFVTGAATASTQIAFSVKPSAGATTMTVSMFKSASLATIDQAKVNAVQDGTTSKGTLIQRYNVTVAATSLSGAYSSAFSAVRTVLTGTAGAAETSNTDETGATSVVNALTSLAFINVNLRDAYNVELPAGALIINATNGAGLAWNASGGASASGFNLVAVATDTTGTVTVARPAASANRGFSTTVTIAYNGAVVGTKAITFQGEVATVTASAPAIGALSASNTSAFRLAYADSAGTALYPVITATSAVSSTLTGSVTGLAVGTIGSSTALARGTLTCGATAGSADVQVQHLNSLSGSVVRSNVWKSTCAGDAATYTASWDKASYTPGSIATLSITFRDARGNLANAYTAVSTTANLITVTGGPSATAVTPPADGNSANSADGVKTYQFVVGTTEGDFSAVVSVPVVNAASATAANQTVGYKVANAVSGTSNADVLKAIVSLIASINKQIAALQKALLRR